MNVTWVHHFITESSVEVNVASLGKEKLQGTHHASAGRAKDTRLTVRCVPPSGLRRRHRRAPDVQARCSLEPSCGHGGGCPAHISSCLMVDARGPRGASRGDLSLRACVSGGWGRGEERGLTRLLRWWLRRCRRDMACLLDDDWEESREML